jgi:lipopolysaccharide export system protein LptA
MISVFYTTSYEEQAYINQVYSELDSKQTTGDEKYVPAVSKWDFEIMFPIEGVAGSYHWKVKGAYAANRNEREQCIYSFTGETMDEKNPVRLISSEMIYIDDEKELYTTKPFFAQMGWGSISGKNMVLRLDRDTVEVRNGVEVALEVAELPEGVAGSLGAEIVSAEKTETSEVKTEAKKDGEKQEQLVITSEKLKILGKEDKAIFTGDVVGRDKQGTISADVMEVQNYTKDERKADPAKNGVKTVVCKGHVKIDLPDQAAKCHYAIFDAAANTVTLIGSEVANKYVQVEYWTKDGQQILCDKVIINRETKEAEFIGNQKSTDYNPSKSSFLDFGLEEGKDKDKGKDKENTPDSNKEQKEEKGK